ncbi:MAG: VanW family protein [Candidatus Peregrinibacteria bacterium GW2011_GWA2_44_7]|nr:MAG: VanW family protein [Candidatus Peregrinibacteria bacterium GW2011_GWA2_44_7]
MVVIVMLSVFLNINATFASKDTDENPTFALNFLGETHSLTPEELQLSLTEQPYQELSGLFPHFNLFRWLLTDKQYEFTGNPEKINQALRELWKLPEPQSAFFVKEGKQLSIQPEIKGYTFDVHELLKTLNDETNPSEFYTLKTVSSTIVTMNDLEARKAQMELLLAKGLQIQFEKEIYAFPAQLKDIEFKKEAGVVHAHIQKPFLDYVLHTLESTANREPQDMHLLEVNTTEVAHAVSQGHVKDGLTIEPGETQRKIQESVDGGQTFVEGAYIVLPGKILNETGQDLGTFELLGTGYSYFKQSSWGRDQNIRKALNEHFNSIVVPPGATFSYNAFLGEVDGANGWKQALTIFKTTQLEYRPGGGICQVSTTLYRAILDAGLEITEQRPHSLYILYYQEGGDGLDATVFPGEQDLKFVNNTPGYLFLEAYDDGFDAWVKIYGENDGRTTEFEGPYTMSNQTDQVIAALGEPIKYYQIAWKYILTHGDGTVEEKWLKSSYKSKVKQY